MDKIKERYPKNGILSNYIAYIVSNEKIFRQRKALKNEHLAQLEFWCSSK